MSIATRREGPGADTATATPIRAMAHGLDTRIRCRQLRAGFLKTDRLSDSEGAMLMGGACAKAYRWAPKKG
jgi:hypothetical protein